MATSDFSCAICFDTATDPVVTRCGHLFCWECLDHWLSRPNAVLDCPVCKGRTDPSQPGDIIPLYGKGKRSGVDTRPKAPGESSPMTTTDSTSAATTASAAPAASSGSSTETHAATGDSASAQQDAHHERPHAPRAPTPRRTTRNPFRRQNMFDLGNHATTVRQTRWHISSFGFPLMFFGLDSTLTPIFLLLAILYCAYRFLPWRDWKRALERHWQQHDQPPAHAAGPGGTTAAPEAPHAGTPAGPPPLPAASAVAEIQWEYFGVIMCVLGLALLVVY